MIIRTVTCPFCGHEMETRNRHGVEIDLCPRCRGVWLDRGELESILERSSRFLEIAAEEKETPGYRQGELRSDRFNWF